MSDEGLAMSMCDEDLSNFAHFDSRLLDSVLGRFTTIEEPDIAVETQSER